MPQPVGRRGNPVWLADVLRATGLDVVEFRGWRRRGHGDFTDIRGVMVHHTGSDTATAASVAFGSPDLAGPLSQLHIARDGTVTVVAAGVAWHAGAGDYPWLPANSGNRHTIGVECANSGTSPAAPHRRNWPDAQYLAMVDSCAAILRHLGRPPGRAIGHKEYAGRAQGKWDPGAIDMDRLRRDIAGRMDIPAAGRDAVLLRRGSRGPHVAELQRRLKHAYAAYAGGLRIDGVFGAETEAAVREFQRRTPVLTADGVVGPATAAALRLRPG
ncbi:N-acetylmuramoyl-L-alanine amidase [Mycobacterium sp. ITM-2016-00317]|uniref:peptidoglycan recognition protein family protein n=1 Tax=Mycobacterium sp. ITM-2016-00317 TaxID=2099694 RepID=UPI00287FCEFB|nr:N-acetylmuramoyl-L-alanine amidase [Mycobacterium sp. ITM-2016-00317]WNG85451.1 N-acetylmuramoyl-L-alanine amidase [Mycobacterium sp. ITM-2016-00317]